jgi:hypothetical protein
MAFNFFLSLVEDRKYTRISNYVIYLVRVIANRYSKRNNFG